MPPKTRNAVTSVTWPVITSPTSAVNCSTVHTTSLTSARWGWPTEKNANRRLSCSIRPGRPTPSAMKPPPTWAGRASPTRMQARPATTPAAVAVALDAATARRQAGVLAPLNRTRSGSVASPRVALMARPNVT